MKMSDFSPSFFPFVYFASSSPIDSQVPVASLRLFSLSCSLSFTSIRPHSPSHPNRPSPFASKRTHAYSPMW